MTGVTPNQGIRFPELGDAPNGPNGFAQMAQDLEEIGVMHFKSRADRQNKLAGRLRSGMETWIEDLRLKEYWTGARWQESDYVGERFRVADRPLTEEFTELPAGDWRALIGYAWINAPAGEYDVTPHMLGSTPQATGISGRIRMMVQATNISRDHRLDLGLITSLQTPCYPFTHGGGNLTFQLSYFPDASSARFRNNGTKLLMRYLGLRVRP